MSRKHSHAYCVCKSFIDDRIRVTPPWAEFAIDRPAPYLGHPAYGAMFTRQVYIDAGMVVDLNKAMKAARPIPGRKLFEPGTPYGITTGAMIDNSMSTPVCNNDLPKLGGDPLPYDCDVYYLEIPEIIPSKLNILLLFTCISSRSFLNNFWGRWSQLTNEITLQRW